MLRKPCLTCAAAPGMLPTARRVTRRWCSRGRSMSRRPNSNASRWDTSRSCGPTTASWGRVSLFRPIHCARIAAVHTGRHCCSLSLPATFSPTNLTLHADSLVRRGSRGRCWPLHQEAAPKSKARSRFRGRRSDGLPGGLGRHRVRAAGRPGDLVDQPRKQGWRVDASSMRYDFASR